MTKSFSFFIFLFLTLTSFGQINFPHDFKITKPPIVESSFWYRLNDSEAFYVSVKNNNKLSVIEFEDEIDTCSLRIKNGKFIGTDNGEWGGSLTFIPNDTTKKRFVIREGNFKSIFSFKGKIYCLEGLAHLSISEGSLVEIQESDSGFKCKEILKFDDGPMSMTIFGNSLLIVTDKSLVLVKEFKAKVLIKKSFWHGLYPNSVVVHNEKVYIGIRGGIVSVALKNQDLTFFRHKNVKLD